MGNLSSEATESDLQTTFSGFGRIISIRVARNRAGRPRGFAFVELEEEAAAAAVEALKGAQLKGRTMDVVVEQSPSSRRQNWHARRSVFHRRR